MHSSYASEKRRSRDVAQLFLLVLFPSGSVCCGVHGVDRLKTQGSRTHQLGSRLQSHHVY